MKLAAIAAAAFASVCLAAGSASAQFRTVVPHRGHYHVVPTYPPAAVVGGGYPASTPGLGLGGFYSTPGFSLGGFYTQSGVGLGGFYPGPAVYPGGYRHGLAQGKWARS
ncbi:MAG: hypothetical protein K2X87_25225 [Gemmataceae bacterium]|nr:hypothetical protein [Gemmataceae bacterium]